MRYAKEWAIRCMHEAHPEINKDNCFITLTFNDENLPKDKSLDVRTFQLFMKRLRKKVKKPLRFYHSGEYGEIKRRPHYHALIFGYDFPDKQIFRKNNDPTLQLYTSKLLEELWPFGFSTIGQVSFQSASYTARYITKKITGEKAKNYYNGLKPEYATMSKGDGKTTFGLGYAWYQKFGWTDCHANDYVSMRSYKHSVPRYYDLLLKRQDPDAYELIKQQRRENSPEIYEDSPDLNSRARQEQKAQQYAFDRLIRKLDVDS